MSHTSHVPVTLSLNLLLLPAHFRCEAATLRTVFANTVMQRYTVGGSSLHFSSHSTPQLYIYGWFYLRVCTKHLNRVVLLYISQTRRDILQIYYNANVSENLDTHLCLVSSYDDARCHVTSATISSIWTKPGATKPSSSNESLQRHWNCTAALMTISAPHCQLHLLYLYYASFPSHVFVGSFQWSCSAFAIETSAFQVHCRFGGFIDTWLVIKLASYGSKL